MADQHAVEILLVEDNPDDVELTLHAFRKQVANKVQVVRDGAEALDICSARASTPAGTPGRSPADPAGPQVAQGRRDRSAAADQGRPPDGTIPVVVLTSSREEQDMVESYRLGVNSYIVKPVDFDQFSKVAGQLGYYWLLINQPPPAFHPTE